MKGMFWDASSFDKDVCWKLGETVNVESMFCGSPGGLNRTCTRHTLANITHCPSLNNESEEVTLSNEKRRKKDGNLLDRLKISLTGGLIILLAILVSSGLCIASHFGSISIVRAKAEYEARSSDGTTTLPPSDGSTVVADWRSVDTSDAFDDFSVRAHPATL